MRRAAIDQVSFNLRATGLRMQRSLRNMRDTPPRLTSVENCDNLSADWPIILGHSTTALWSGNSPQEWHLTAGKVQNLRQASRQLHGLRIPAGTVFSFWRHVARPTRQRGYVGGRELREGCMVASIGGGLCQLSNALYAAAIAAGCEIVERHRHSRVVPGSLAEVGLDATIFWNYVDLRFRARMDLLIDVALSTTDLVLKLRGAPAILPAEDTNAPRQAALPSGISSIGDCLTCGEDSCVYVIRQEAKAGRTAWLLDESWPEFDAYQAQHVLAHDQIQLPLDGNRWRRPGYAWTLPLDNVPLSYPFLAWRQGRQIRKAGVQGAGLQQALLSRDQALAAAYHKNLPFDADRLVVPLHLLPHLWRLGALGGRRFSVLMTRMPMRRLQQQLDAAAACHPESPTLRDFRAPAWLLAAEEAALAAAARFITPHAAVAAELQARFSGQVRKLDWVLPTARATTRRILPSAGEGARPRILFAGASLARKGSYEMRQMAGELPVSLCLLNRAEEAVDFWHGLDVEHVPPGRDPLVDIDCAVLPAFVEHQPRLLLRAIARGLPVICSPACGLSERPSVHLVEPGDVTALNAAVAEALGLAPAPQQRRLAE